MRTLFKITGNDLFRALIICIERSIQKIDSRDRTYLKGIKTLTEIKEIILRNEINRIYNNF